MKRTSAIAACILLALTAPCLRAEDSGTKESETTPRKYYRLDFSVREVDDSRVVNARSYSGIAAIDSGVSIRTGSRVPVPSGPGSSQFTYMDVGVDIDVRHLAATPNGLQGDITADISSLPSEAGGTPNYAPIVRHNRWNSVSSFPLRKATVIFSSDDLTSKRKMQLEVTATPVP